MEHLVAGAVEGLKARMTRQSQLRRAMHNAVMSTFTCVASSGKQHGVKGRKGKSFTCWWGSWRVKVAAEPSCHDWGQRLS